MEEDKEGDEGGWRKGGEKEVEGNIEWYVVDGSR